jgi:hypothetical protein
MRLSVIVAMPSALAACHNSLQPSVSCSSTIYMDQVAAHLVLPQVHVLRQRFHGEIVYDPTRRPWPFMLRSRLHRLCRRRAEHQQQRRGRRVHFPQVRRCGRKAGNSKVRIRSKGGNWTNLEERMRHVGWRATGRTGQARTQENDQDVRKRTCGRQLLDPPETEADVWPARIRDARCPVGGPMQLERDERGIHTKD